MVDSEENIDGLAARVRDPSGMAPGTYHGRVDILADGAVAGGPFLRTVGERWKPLTERADAVWLPIAGDGAAAKPRSARYHGELLQRCNAPCSHITVQRNGP